MSGKIKIVNVSTDYLQKNKKEIIDLMEESWKASFPEKKINLSEINNRYFSMVKYIENQEGYILAAIMNDRLLGYLWYFITSTNRIHVNQIIINKCSRGQGVGTRLMEALYKDAKFLKIEEVELNVSVVNEKAIKFYLKQNFEEERILMKRDISV